MSTSFLFFITSVKFSTLPTAFIIGIPETESVDSCGEKGKGELSSLTKPSTAWSQGYWQCEICSISGCHKPEPIHNIPHLAVDPAFNNFLAILTGLSTAGFRSFDASFPFKGSFFAFKVQESLIKHSALLDTFVINYE